MKRGWLSQGLRIDCPVQVWGNNRLLRGGLFPRLRVPAVPATWTNGTRLEKMIPNLLPRSKLVSELQVRRSSASTRQQLRSQGRVKTKTEPGLRRLSTSGRKEKRCRTCSMGLRSVKQGSLEETHGFSLGKWRHSVLP